MKINEDKLLMIFFAIHLILIFSLPKLFEIKIDLWTQILGYLGGLLLGIQFVGESRITIADKKLSENAKEIIQKLNKFLTYYFLTSKEIKKERREIGLWYFLSFLDLIAWIILLSYILPEYFNISGKDFISKYKWYLYLIMILPILIAIPIRFISKRNSKLYFIFFKIIWLPSAILGAWITIPWLVFVFITWFILQVLLGVVHLKNKFSLGNMFYILGFILLSLSFILFIIGRISNNA